MTEKKSVLGWVPMTLFLGAFVVLIGSGSVMVFQGFEERAHRVEMKTVAEQYYGIEFPEGNRYDRVVPTEDGGFTVVENVGSVDGQVFDRVKVVRDGDRLVIQVPETGGSERFVDLEPLKLSR